MDVHRCIEILKASENEILTYLQDTIVDHPITYETFGKDIEPFVVQKLIEILTREGVIKSEKDYEIAPTKNDFPDFTLRCAEPALAIEIKAGNHSKKVGDKWQPCKNSENDMGTLNRWPEKLALFGGDNIYYLFIEYIANEYRSEILAVKIAPFYKFLGLNRDKTLKYREKDGNTRPKDFDAPSPINSTDEFVGLLDKTESYRSKRIILKHWRQLSQTDKEEILPKLSSPQQAELFDEPGPISE